jgi:predicted small secreted protein
MKKYLYLLLALHIVFCLSGCNTLRGFGTDIKRGGEAIEGVGK